jgi:hypothetical protein
MISARPTAAGEAELEGLLSWVDQAVGRALRRRPAGPSTSGAGLGRAIQVRPGVNLTPQMRRVLGTLEPYMRRAGLRVWVTSGYRTPQHQLDIIRRAAIARGLQRKYPSIVNATVENIASWRDAWDELLHRHRFVVNPPVRVRSRIRDTYYNPSPHTRGKAFDLAGAPLDQIAAAVRSYQQAGGPISQILIERVNNAVHIGLR